MDDASPEAFREKFREARRKRRIAILVVTTVTVLIGRGIIWLFLPEITRDATRWAIILLLPVAWFGWWVGSRLGDEFEVEVWNELRLTQKLAGITRQSLASMYEETLGEAEIYRRRQEAERAAEAAANPPEDQGTTTPPSSGADAR